MVNVLNWKNTLEALIELKSHTEQLSDTEATFEVDGVCLHISVKSGKATVCKTDEPSENALKLSHNEAEKLLFAPFGLIKMSDVLKNVAPLPFFIHAADAF